VKGHRPAVNKLGEDFDTAAEGIDDVRQRRVSSERLGFTLASREMKRSRRCKYLE
jgi:hypothetical protein